MQSHRPQTNHISGQAEDPGKSSKKKHRRPWPLHWVVVCDVFLLGIGLILFSLFHHVIPRDIQTSGISLPRPTSDITTEVETSSFSSTIETSMSNPTNNPGTDSETIAYTSTETQADPDDWQVKFTDHFTDGEIIKTQNEYRSANLAVTVEQIQRDDAVYYLADIYLSSIEQFRTAFASGVYGRGLSDNVLGIARENNALLAISGDYYGIRDQGIVIRNGEMYRDVLFQDVLVMYYDGTMETTEKSDFDLDRILSEGAWQAWSFGPMLLDNGQPMTKFNSQVNPDNPRGAIGYYEPGHYCLVLVDGRQPGYSNGMTLQELSDLFFDLGCKVAYNLDGGQSAVMTFLDSVANQPYKDGRKISDIVYITEIDGQGD